MKSIPYDPGLVLGNLVDKDLLAAVLAVSEANQPSDRAQEELNSLIHSRRSLKMTIDELIGMNINTDKVVDSLKTLDTQITKAAEGYADAVVKAQEGTRVAIGKLLDFRIKPKSSGGVAVHASPESPIDYNATQIKKMPLSADSLKLDVQYFSNDQNDEGSGSTVSTLKGYISSTTSFLGNSRSTQITGSVSRQASSQYQRHKIAGTLVISAGCTHKDAVLLAPLIIDPDKAIRVWNMLYKDDQISTDHPQDLVAKVMKDEEMKNAMQIITGATYGSSFVGMVHVLRTEETDSNQTMIAAAASLQQQASAGSWFAKQSGGFGLEGSFASDIKRLMSLQQISSHCSIVTMGSIPSIRSNSVKIGVKEFADFDGAKMMEKLATLHNATASEQDSVAASAEAARTGGKMVAFQAAQVKSVMAGLQDVDDGQNKMLDINSLMTAFEDYVDKALTGNIGVPINYYLRDITKSALAHLWVAKYFPQYLAIQEDDKPTPAPAPTPGT